MNNTHVLTKQPGLGTLSRPRFTPGLLLEDEDLTAGVDYTRNMMRLMFRSLFGCGVVCGLAVEAKLIGGRKLSVTVHEGVALDYRGNPIEVPTSQTLEYDWDCKPPGWPIWVTLCYVEKCCRPKDVSCSFDGDGSVVQTRSLDAFEIRLYDQRPECACTCQPLDEAPTPSTNCACYDKQLTDPAPCGSECDCDCVVIGYFDKPSNTAPDVPVSAPEVRRFIRPVPAGFRPCLAVAAAATVAVAQTSGTGTAAGAGTVAAAGTDAVAGTDGGINLNADGTD